MPALEPIRFSHSPKGSPSSASWRPRSKTPAPPSPRAATRSAPLPPPATSAPAPPATQASQRGGGAGRAGVWVVVGTVPFTATTRSNIIASNIIATGLRRPFGQPDGDHTHLWREIGVARPWGAHVSDNVGSRCCHRRGRDDGDVQRGVGLVAKAGHLNLQRPGGGGCRRGVGRGHLRGC